MAIIIPFESAQALRRERQRIRTQNAQDTQSAQIALSTRRARSAKTTKRKKSKTSTRRSADEILREYVRTMILVRRALHEDESICGVILRPEVVDLRKTAGLTRSQVSRLAQTVSAMANSTPALPESVAIESVWKIFDEDSPEPTEEALLEIIERQGIRGESGFQKLVVENRAAVQTRLRESRAMQED